MNTCSRMLLENKAWAEEMVRSEPAFFLRHLKGQDPQVLWVGCADSRVPAEFITNAAAGSLFVHRNVANLAQESDLSFMSVLEYAVVALGVRHVVLCGHHGCGGVQAAMSPARQDLAHVNRHLADIRQTWRAHQHELADIADAGDRVNRLVALNVMAQVRHLAANPIIRQAWRRSEWPVLHGWVYELATGHLDELTCIDRNTRQSDTTDVSNQTISLTQKGCI